MFRLRSSPQRFYSMSGQIRIARNAYYDILEATQKGDLDITYWLQWFHPQGELVSAVAFALHCAQ